jgi:hypothetical protein
VLAQLLSQRLIARREAERHEYERSVRLADRFADLKIGAYTEYLILLYNRTLKALEANQRQQPTGDVAATFAGRFDSADRPTRDDAEHLSIVRLNSQIKLLAPQLSHASGKAFAAYADLLDKSLNPATTMSLRHALYKTAIREWESLSKTMRDDLSGAPPAVPPKQLGVSSDSASTRLEVDRPHYRLY